MQKTSLIVLFSLSSVMCGGAVAALKYQSWPIPSHKRQVATVVVAIDKDREKSLPRSYKIASTFKRSRKIWGVYDKYQDHLEPIKQPGSKSKTIKTSLGELILKDGQVVLVSPLSADGITQVEMAKLPYAKIGKNKYDIDLSKATDDQRAALVRLYAPLIEGIEGHETAQVDHMTCSKRKSRLSCELNVTMQ